MRQLYDEVKGLAPMEAAKIEPMMNAVLGACISFSLRRGENPKPEKIFYPGSRKSHVHDHTHTQHVVLIA